MKSSAFSILMYLSHKSQYVQLLSTNFSSSFTFNFTSCKTRNRTTQHSSYLQYRLIFYYLISVRVLSYRSDEIDNCVSFCWKIHARDYSTCYAARTRSFSRSIRTHSVSSVFPFVSWMMWCCFLVPPTPARLFANICGLGEQFSPRHKRKLMGRMENGKKNFETNLPSRQMRKQIQTYKLISKLSNFRSLLKHLPEDTSAVRRCFISEPSFRNKPSSCSFCNGTSTQQLCHKFAFSIKVYIHSQRRVPTMTSLHLF